MKQGKVTRIAGGNLSNFSHGNVNYVSGFQLRAVCLCVIPWHEATAA